MTVLARLADKSAKLRVLAMHGYRPWDNQPLKEKNLCLSLLGLAKKERKLNLPVLHFKESVYTLNLYCGWGGGGASILNPESMSTKVKIPCQTVNIEQESRAR